MTDRATGMWRDPEGVPSGARMRNWKLGFPAVFSGVLSDIPVALSVMRNGITNIIVV
jgi:hypothetical protein